TPATKPATTTASDAPKPPRGRFAAMTIEELQTKYLEVVGRATGSDDRRYLIWKIREAEKGRIPVGPRKTRERDGEPLDVKILPLRLEADVADKMDEAWRAKGIKNRMEFFRARSARTSRSSAPPTSPPSSRTPTRRAHERIGPANSRFYRKAAIHRHAFVVHGPPNG